MMRQRLGQAIRELRLREGRTIIELAAQAGIARETLIAVEGGKANPTLETLKRIARALGYSLSELVVHAEVRQE